MLGSLTTFALVYLASTSVGALLASWLAVVAWRRRDQPAAPQFALLNVTVAGWCYTAVLARLGVPGADYIWHINNIFVFSLIYVWFGFVLAYTGRSEWIRRWPLLVLWAIPGSVVLTALYPPAQSILVVDGPAKVVEGLTVVPWTFTDLGAASLVFVFLLDGVAFLLLGLFTYRTRSPYRKQAAAIVGARLFGLGTGVAFYAGLFPYEDLSLVPAAYAVQSTIIAWALFRYDLLDVVPLTADTIVDQMADAVVVLDADDRLVDHNPALADLIARDGDLLGQHVDELLPGLRPAIESDTATPFMPTGPAGGGRHYQPQTTELYDHHDVYRGQLVVLRDVTLQRTRERTLKALQSATERFLDASDAEAVADIATETAQQALSCPFSGVARYDAEADRLEPVAVTDELRTVINEHGLVTAEGEPSAAWPARDSVLWDVFDRNEARHDEPLVLRADDPEATIATTLLFPLGEHGVLGVGKRDGAFDAEDRRFARTLADSTETALDRLRRERELEASRRTVEQRTEQLRFFNSALRHDLRNSVMVIDANLEFLSEHVAAAGRSHFETVSRWIADMHDLIDTVGSLTETITDADGPDHSVTDLAAVLESRAEKVADAHDAASVETTLPEELRVLCDDLVGEVVENVLLNAIEHNDTEAPHITVTASAGEDGVRVEIADNGPGIPEQFRGEVFSPGVTAGDSGTIGFGLYFVKVMMEEYGGSVRFEENEPRGTTAILDFPPVQAADAVATAGSEETSD